jgi:hypothetical protein
VLPFPATDYQLRLSIITSFDVLIVFYHSAAGGQTIKKEHHGLLRRLQEMKLATRYSDY